MNRTFQDKLPGLSIRVAARILSTVCFSFLLFIGSLALADTPGIKDVHVRPGSDEKVQYEPPYPEDGWYQLWIFPFQDGPKLKSSWKDYEVVVPGKALWEGPDPATAIGHRYKLYYPGELPHGLLVRGNFDLEGGGPEPGPKNEFAVDVQETLAVVVNSVTPDPLILGYDILTVDYAISPTTNFTADSAVLQMLGYEAGSQLFELFYEDAEISRAGGQNQTTWDGKSNTPGWDGLYVSARRSPYGAKVVMKYGTAERAHALEFTVRANALSAESVPANASIVKDKIVNLGYHEVDLDPDLTRSEALGYAPRRLVWYSVGHGGSGSLWFDIGGWLAPADLPGNLHYRLVFLNNCEGGQSVDEWLQKFGAQAFVGFRGLVRPYAYSGWFAEAFFESLMNYRTVGDAYAEAHRLFPLIDDFDPVKRGEGTVVQLAGS